jgi:excisionase family DNA binding protein
LWAKPEEVKIVENKKFYNTKEVAEMFGVNVQTIREYKRKKQIRAAKVGNSFIFPAWALEEFIQKRMDIENEDN